MSRRGGEERTTSEVVGRPWGRSILVARGPLVPLPAAAQVRATLKGHRLALASVDYSPDGRYLATGSYDRTAKIWDAATGTEVATLGGHQGTVEAAWFPPARQNLGTSRSAGPERR